MGIKKGKPFSCNTIMSYESKVRFVCLVLLAICAIQFSPLFMFESATSKCFFDDWCDNLFLISYFVNFWHNKGALPISFSGEILGSNIFLLYGYGFYPLISLPSFVFNSEISLKLIIFLLAFIKVLLVFLIISRKNKYVLSLLICIISVWSKYNQTILFSAGSLPSVIGSEFLANGLLIILLGIKIKRNIFIFFGLIIFGYAGFCWPGHIIHSLILILPMLFLMKTRAIGWLIFGGAIMLVASTPYILSLYSYSLGTPNFTLGLGWFEHLDNIYNRLLPFPYDKKQHLSGLIPFETPNFDAQINIYLILLVLVFAFFNIKRRDRYFLVGSFYTLFGLLYLALSVANGVEYILPKVFTAIHFNYRYIHYSEVSFLLALAIFGSNKDFDINKTRYLLTFFAGCIFLNMFIKGVHSYYSYGHIPFNNFGPSEVEGFEDNKQRVKKMFGAELFANQKEKSALLFYYPKSAAQVWSYSDIKMKLLSGKFDKCQNKIKPENKKIQQFDISEKCFLRLPIFPFSKNQIYIDGVHIEWISLYQFDGDPAVVYASIDPGVHSISLEEFSGNKIERMRQFFVIPILLIIFIGFAYLIFLSLTRKFLNNDY